MAGTVSFHGLWNGIVYDSWLSLYRRLTQSEKLRATFNFVFVKKQDPVCKLYLRCVAVKKARSNRRNNGLQNAIVHDNWLSFYWLTQSEELQPRFNFFFMKKDVRVYKFYLKSLAMKKARSHRINNKLYCLVECYRILRQTAKIITANLD